MKIMLLGDVHGNLNFVLDYVIPAAIARGVDWIYQVGDFGYWEHTDKGTTFLDKVGIACAENNLSWLFIQGNHDKVSLIPKLYHEVAGFYLVRPSLWFAPNGTVWSPDDGNTNFLALGGAYSLDKQYRLEEERAAARRLSVYDPEEGAQVIPTSVYTAETLWFPEEEMTEKEFQSILNTTEAKIDVILAHDKPLASNTPVKLSPIPECEPNQRRLQEAVKKFQPSLFVHGHLHIRYEDGIRTGNNNSFTQVLGLGADIPNYNQPRSSWEPSDAWEILNL